MSDQVLMHTGVGVRAETPLTSLIIGRLFFSDFSVDQGWPVGRHLFGLKWPYVCL
jgi:hypothetical protein